MELANCDNCHKCQKINTELELLLSDAMWLCADCVLIINLEQKLPVIRK